MSAATFCHCEEKDISIFNSKCKDYYENNKNDTTLL